MSEYKLFDILDSEGNDVGSIYVDGEEGHEIGGIGTHDFCFYGCARVHVILPRGLQLALKKEEVLYDRDGTDQKKPC